MNSSPVPFNRRAVALPVDAEAAEQLIDSALADRTERILRLQVLWRQAKVHLQVAPAECEISLLVLSWDADLIRIVGACSNRGSTPHFGHAHSVLYRAQMYDAKSELIVMCEDELARSSLFQMLVYNRQEDHFAYWLSQVVAATMAIEANEELCMPFVFPLDLAV